MTHSLILTAILVIVALAFAIWSNARLRRQQRRDVYCRMTCINGSEMGTCPCVSPRECRVIRNEKVAS